MDEKRSNAVENGGVEKEKTVVKQGNFFDFLYSPLTFVKSAFLFWFSGANQAFCFSSVFFKQQGLSISFISLMTSISVVIEVTASFLYGMILDKFGRAKLILLINISLAIIVSISFVLLPTVQNCNEEAEFLFHCNHTATLKMKHPELCNSTEGIIHIGDCSPVPLNQFSCNSSKIVNLEIPPGTENYTDKMRLVGRDGIIVECMVNDSCTNELIKNEERCSGVTNSDHTLLLVVYGVLICLYQLSRSVTFRYFDFIAVALSAKHGADFGRQQMFGIFGVMMGAPVVGYIIRIYQTKGWQHCYSITFLAYMLLASLSGLSICTVDCRVKPPGQKVWKEFFALLKRPEVIMYLIVLLVMGTSLSFNWIFLSLFQEELGSSALEIGITITMKNGCGLPFLITARWWIDKLGNRALSSLALFLGAFFHVAVSYAQSSLPIMFLVLAHVFTYHLLWVDAMNFARIIAPEKVSGTVIFTAGTVFYTVSKASASLIGGMLMSAYGSRVAHRVLGGLCLTTGMIYVVFKWCLSKEEKPKKCPSS